MIADEATRHPIYMLLLRFCYSFHFSFFFPPAPKMSSKTLKHKSSQCLLIPWQAVEFMEVKKKIFFKIYLFWISELSGSHSISGMTSRNSLILNGFYSRQRLSRSHHRESIWIGVVKTQVSWFILFSQKLILGFFFLQALTNYRRLVWICDTSFGGDALLFVGFSSSFYFGTMKTLKSSDIFFLFLTGEEKKLKRRNLPFLFHLFALCAE